MAGRDARARFAGAFALAATLMVVVGCGSDRAPQAVAPATITVTESPAEDTPAPAGNTSSAAEPTAALTRVDPSAFDTPQSPGTYTWNFSTGGRHLGLCVSGGAGVTCTGTADSSVPDLTQHFPGRPSAIGLGSAGLRYTFVEGVPAGPGRLDAGQLVEIGDVRCERPDGTSLRCSSGGNSFLISGPNRTISTSGTVLPEQHYSTNSSSGAGQPREYIGASGLVSGVRISSGQIVSASVPPCDGRGILILDSFVETGQPQQGIADLLNRHPGAEFATPGHCPSLRGELNGARVYPIYTDHGHDTAALCSDKASRGGNARLLTSTAQFTDPC